MSVPKVLILTALRIEAKHLRAALSDADARLCLIGMGAGHLPDIGQDKPNCVILAGFAGGLSPELHVGAVVIDTAGQPYQLPRGCQSGTVHNAGSAVSSPAEKTRLFLDTKCVAVDMESCRVRAWARELGLPLVIIRSISDEAEDSIDAGLLAGVDEYGSVRLGRIALAILRNPVRLRRLVRLARCASKAGKNLGRAVHQFIELNGAEWSCKGTSGP